MYETPLCFTSEEERSSAPLLARIANSKSTHASVSVGLDKQEGNVGHVLQGGV